MSNADRILQMAHEKNGMITSAEVTNAGISRGHLKILVDKGLLERVERGVYIIPSGNIEMHHVKKLKDLESNCRKEKPEWMKRMMAMKRKTLAVCLECHAKIHSGKYDGKKFISANVC